MWPDEVDDVLGGDLTCAIAYVTPAGGAVVTAVAPIGLRDREANTVGFTTSLGFGRKLDRLRTEPRIAMAYHAREHGVGDGANRRYVLVQGRASFDAGVTIILSSNEVWRGLPSSLRNTPDTSARTPAALTASRSGWVRES